MKKAVAATLLLFCLMSWLSSAQENLSCKYDGYNVLPVPVRAQNPGLAGSHYNNSVLFFVEKLTDEPGVDGIYFFTTVDYNTFFIVAPGNKEVLVVDAPDYNLQAGIQTITDAPITVFVYSHFHNDHSFAVPYLNYSQSAVFIGHEETANQLKSRGAPQFSIPTVTFCDNYTFSFGRYDIELSYFEVFNAHTPGNTLIWIPKASLLETVDIIYPRWLPFHRLGETENVTALLGNIDKILEFPFKIFVAGHVTRWGTYEDVVEGKNFYVDLLKVAEETMIADPTYFLDKFTGPDQNSWNAIRVWYDTQSCNCEQIMIEHWGSILGAVDIYVNSACAQIQSEIRLATNPFDVKYPTKNQQFVTSWGPCPDGE